MTEASRPFDGTIVGDSGPYGSEDWREIWRNVLGWGGERANAGVFLGSGAQPNDGLLVQAQSPTTTSVNVLRGAALVRGIFYLNDAAMPFVVANNASGNPRIDTVVLRADYIAQTVRLALKQGAPAVSPTSPTLTQTVGVMWEIPVADVAVADSFVSISQPNITQRQEWVNAPPGVYLDSVLNNSGGELISGDVVMWDNTADRAVTTTTVLGDDRVIGVWSGKTAAAGYGRVLRDGIGYVNASGAVARGDLLQPSTVAKQASIISGGPLFIARALETTSGAGLVLCDIRVVRVTEGYALLQDQKTQNTAGGAFTNGAWRTRDLNTEVVDTNNLVAINTPLTNQFTLQPGTYRVRWDAPAFNAVFRHQSRLRNITDTIDYMGSSEQTATANSAVTHSLGVARFQITTAKVFELQHICSTTVAVNGFGVAANFATEIFSTVELWREGL